MLTKAITLKARACPIIGSSKQPPSWPCFGQTECLSVICLSFSLSLLLLSFFSLLLSQTSPSSQNQCEVVSKWQETLSGRMVKVNGQSK